MLQSTPKLKNRQNQVVVRCPFLPIFLVEYPSRKFYVCSLHGYNCKWEKKGTCKWTHTKAEVEHYMRMRALDSYHSMGGAGPNVGPASPASPSGGALTNSAGRLGGGPAPVLNGVVVFPTNFNPQKCFCDCF